MIEYFIGGTRKDDKLPSFDATGTASKKTLAAISTWQPDFNSRPIYAGLHEFLQACWNADYGKIFESEDDDGEKQICFATGGWSSNEAIMDALDKNSLFNTLAWDSSHRGGLHKYAAKYLITMENGEIK
jgi:hypothetical protein